MLKKLRFLFLAATLMSVLGGVVVASTFQCDIIDLSQGTVHETQFFATYTEAKAWANKHTATISSDAIYQAGQTAASVPFGTYQPIRLPTYGHVIKQINSVVEFLSGLTPVGSTMTGPRLSGSAQ